MKTFIVFLALLLVMSCMFVFQNDMDRYIRLQDDLKTLAEECANGGAMCISSTYGEPGVTLINAEAAQKYCEYRCSETDLSGGTVTASSSLTHGGTALVVRLVWTGQPLFRLSFVRSVDTLSREACYEWK